MRRLWNMLFKPKQTEQADKLSQDIATARSGAVESSNRLVDTVRGLLDESNRLRNEMRHPPAHY